MNAEEFLEKRFDVVREALGSYVNKMEESAGVTAELSRVNPKNAVYADMSNDLYKQRDAGVAASQDLFKLAQKMGKL